MTGSLRLGSARAAVAELVQLFPRGLFEDALPPLARRSHGRKSLPCLEHAPEGPQHSDTRAVSQPLCGSAGVRSLQAGHYGA